VPELRRGSIVARPGELLQIIQNFNCLAITVVESPRFGALERTHELVGRVADADLQVVVAGPWDGIFLVVLEAGQRGQAEGRRPRALHGGNEVLPIRVGPYLRLISSRPRVMSHSCEEQVVDGPAVHGVLLGLGPYLLRHHIGPWSWNRFVTRRVLLDVYF